MQLTVESRRGVRHVRPHIGAGPFPTVVLEVDRGISAIDGIDWLAARRGDLVARKVTALAEQARDGVLGAGEAYAERLALVRPRRDEVSALSRAYYDAIVPDCTDAIRRFRRAGIRVVIVSRGLRPAMYGVVHRLGIDVTDVHAVDVRFDAIGTYAGFDRSSGLTTAAGKRVVLAGLNLEGPVLVTGHDPSEYAVESFAQLATIVLP